ncbi:uncharacterized protein LOC121376891 [Gigantopelta aegis]|uniref:uncharacterized protein LOC121376891 n=1 Tax=Gigantopelta aegis TaxID=1735272 RepID=UPI001B887A82|nr:uncharacterized protein LOC121376891 [Gigantopelta aegis]
MATLQKFRSTSDDLSPSTINVNFFDDNNRTSPAGLRSSSFTYEKSNGALNEDPEFPAARVPGKAEPIVAEPSGFWKKLRTREAILIILGCVLLIGLAVGTACAIIFTQTDSSSSPTEATSSIPPSTSSSSSASSSSISTSSPSPYLIYNGDLNLTRLWKGSLQELNSNFSKDMRNIVYNTSLEKSYSSSKVTDYKYDKMYVAFSLSFTSKLLEIPLTTTRSMALNAAYAIIIENLFREQVARGKSSLPIQPETIHIFDYIPLTSTSASTSSSTSTSTTTSPTTTPSSAKCYPLKYERCRSVGYNMTYFPNKFGDRNEAAAIPLFEALNNKTLGSNCSAVSLFYLCGIWFPECDENFSPAEPCPDVCEEFNADCKGDLLYSVECDHFNKPNCQRPSPTTTVSTTVPTTTPPTYTCSNLDYRMCNQLGFNYTYLPNYGGNRKLSDAIKELESYSDSVVHANCSKLTEFYFCGIYFPTCGPEDQRLLPCRNVCQTLDAQCGLNVSLFFCDTFPQDNCLVPPPDLLPTSPPPTTTVTTPSTTTAEPKPCVELNFLTCRNLGYNSTRYPNMFGSRGEQEAITMFNYYAALSLKVGCSDKGLEFFCSLLFPKCDETSSPRVKYPCMDFCEEVTTSCKKFLTFPIDCSLFFNDTSMCRQSTATTTPAPTTPKPAQCIQTTYDYCSSEGYNSTYLPTWFATSMTGSVNMFNRYALSTINNGCSSIAKFFYCGVFFPQCNPDELTVRLPCRSVCEEMSDQCGSVWSFPLDCLAFTDNTSNCLMPPVTTTTPSPTTPSKPARCEPLDKDLCKTFGFNVTHLPNLWLANSQDQALNMYYAYGEKSVSLGCHEDALFYLCSVIFPQCDDRGNLHLSCRDVCQNVNAKCLKTGLFGQNCDRVSSTSPSCLSPPIKPVCKIGEFACFGTPKCIPEEKVCDRTNDCFDWSDERNCTCIKKYEFQCGMGHCIKSYQRCDEVVDCPDRTDEENCTCPSGQFTCAENECIMPEWVCDGQKDCSNGIDELNCGVCNISEFSCLSGECIPLTRQCDGTPQCPDQSDERQCIFAPEGNNPLTLRFYKQGLVPVCAAYFNSSLADLACQKLGHKGHYNWTTVNYSTFIYAYPDGIGTETTVLGRATLRRACLNSRAVVLNCVPKECGTRKSHMISFIVNGNNAAKGAWPWQVSIQRVRKHYCGGSLISDKFVITAAHCVEAYRLDFRYIEVVVGATDISKKEKYQRRIKIKRLTIHNHIYHVKNDVALIELAEPVVFNDYVRPVCLPDDRDVFSRSSQCYATGWGRTVSFEGPKPAWLQEAKMSLWNTEKCNSSLAWNSRISDTHVCAGYYSGIISPCLGDSGGPLVCLTNENTWKLRGVTSFVSKKCKQPGRPAVFSDVIVFKDWILENTRCKFKCSNGICLYDDKLLCNRKDDCGDNSDEILPCNLSVNCTFDDPFLCGYYVQFRNLAVTDFNNHYPLYDHTHGNYRGKFMTARSSGRIMTSPVYKMNVTHCLRFFYHLRGRLGHGLQVWSHEMLKNKWDAIFQRGNTVAPDRWFMGDVTFNPGEYEIVFMANDEARISIDDVSVVPGDCEHTDCPPGEFTCPFGSSLRCIPTAARCNFIADCDNAEDELQCQASEYTCDFENNLLCGFEQHTDDDALAEWRVGNSSITPKKMADNTFKNESGSMLFLDTRRVLEGQIVQMSQNVFFTNSINCLKFHYFSDASGKLQIQYTKNGSSNTVVIWTMVDRLTHGWTHTQVNIGVSGRVTLDYVMTSGQYKGTYRPFIALDDVQISGGACGAFTCPSGSMRCVSENYCLKSDRFCDRIVDCTDASDEAGCKCTEDEFKCPDGPCIPKSKTCDRTVDCKDGSDESAVCDSKVGVSCDFEDSFVCGYNINTTTYKWERHSGPTDTPNTGPKKDNTYGTSSGHYIYADGTYGKYSATSALETPSFSTTSAAGGSAVEFSYNIFSAFYRFYDKLGSLTIVVVDNVRVTRTEVFTADADGDTSWKRRCVNLPTSANLTLVFVAQRGDENQADVALDDVKLLTTRCPIDATSPTTTTDSSLGILETTTSVGGCPPGKKPCDSGLCLDQSLFCDNIQDCPNGSDERGCP